MTPDRMLYNMALASLAKQAGAWDTVKQWGSDAANFAYNHPGATGGAIAAGLSGAGLAGAAGLMAGGDMAQGVFGNSGMLYDAGQAINNWQGNTGGTGYYNPLDSYYDRQAQSSVVQQGPGPKKGPTANPDVNSIADIYGGVKGSNDPFGNARQVPGVAGALPPR